MAHGSCLCGGVVWRLEGAGFRRMTHCHCSMCRKAHGAAFATYATVARAAFELVEGGGLVVDRASSPGFHRAFCGRCGSVVPSALNGEEVHAPMGGMRDDPGWRATHHIFIAHKAPWHRIADDLPRYDHYGPGVEGPVVERAGAGDGLGGCCLCGAAAFEVTAPFRAVYNCHCSRCRYARQAAHTTNGFAPMDGFRWLRGEDEVEVYRLPEARFFAQAFCRTCGAGLPRVDSGRGVAVVPLGALDGDPGRGAHSHIFTDFMATWYRGDDGLPRHPGPPPA